MRYIWGARGISFFFSGVSTHVLYALHACMHARHGRRSCVRFIKNKIADCKSIFFTVSFVGRFWCGISLGGHN